MSTFGLRRNSLVPCLRRCCGVIKSYLFQNCYNRTSKVNLKKASNLISLWDFSILSILLPWQLLQDLPSIKNITNSIIDPFQIFFSGDSECLESFLYYFETFWYFTNFSFNHNWNEAQLLVINMVYTRFLASCWTTYPVGKRHLQDVLKMSFQEKQDILPRHLWDVQKMS